MDKAGCIEENDVGALTTEQQTKLNDFKVLSFRTVIKVCSEYRVLDILYGLGNSTCQGHI